MADVKWIKIVTDIFDDEKILMIETLPECDTIIVIWFKLLCLAGKQNNSGVFQMGHIPYTDEMFATIFRRPLNTVRLALSTFERFGMVEIINDVITIPNWGKHQSLEQLEERRKYQREYQQKYRKKQKLLTSGESFEDENKCLRKHLHKPNVNTLEEDIEEEQIREKELYSSIVSHLNEKAGTKYKASTEKTKKAIHARLADGFTLDDFKTVIDKKCTEWIGTEFEKFLRPETLFGNKFEGYLNAKVTNGRNGSNGGASGNHVPDTKKIGNYI